MRQGMRHGPHRAPHGGRPPGVRPVERTAAPPAPRPGRRLRLRGRSAHAVTGTTLLLLAVGAAPAFAAPAASDERDVQLVYCLDRDHRPDLVDAAVRLRVLRPDSVAGLDRVRPSGAGGRMTLERWAERREKDFERACSALMAAASEAPVAAAKDSGEESWIATFLKGLPLLAAGALLTLGGQFSERHSAERRLFKQQLSADESAYRTAVGEYLAGYEHDPRTDHSAVRTTREALAGTLSRVPGPSTRRAAARLAADGLPLAQPLPDARDGYLLDTDARADDAERERASVERHLRSISDLNRTLLHWSWLTLRTRIARRTAPGAAV